VRCSILQRVAVWCSVLQCGAVCCSVQEAKKTAVPSPWVKKEGHVRAVWSQQEAADCAVAAKKSGDTL